MSCCIGTQEQVYQTPIPGQGENAAYIDTSALATRGAVLFWNDGANLVRIMPNNPQFTFSNGFPIYPQTGLILAVGQGIKHYGLCATGQSSLITALEVGT